MKPLSSSTACLAELLVDLSFYDFFDVLVAFAEVTGEHAKVAVAEADGAALSEGEGSSELASPILMLPACCICCSNIINLIHQLVDHLLLPPLGGALNALRAFFLALRLAVLPVLGLRRVGHQVQVLRVLLAGVLVGVRAGGATPRQGAGLRHLSAAVAIAIA